MMASPSPSVPYPTRLQTFQGFWDSNSATARQLAAIGHVYDRPPLEALEEGTRCISCSNFVRRELSVRALEGPAGSYGDGFANFQFHHPTCTWLQIRIPLEPQAIFGLHGFRMSDMKNRFETREAPPPATATPTSIPAAGQTSRFFSLPVELRLQIYSYILPTLPKTTTIVPLNRDSARIVTEEGYLKTGPRDLTKTNILRTCLAIHNEALDILYAHTTYKFSNNKKFTATKILYLFLRHIGANGRQLLKAVDVRCYNREDAIAFALLADCAKLRSITIRLSRRTILFSWAPPWCVEGMACLLDLSGLEEVYFADPGDDIKFFLSEQEPDSKVLRKEILRVRGSPGTLRWVDGMLDI